MPHAPRLRPSILLLAAVGLVVGLAPALAQAAPATLGQAIAEQRGEPYVGPLLDKLFVVSAKAWS